MFLNFTFYKVPFKFLNFCNLYLKNFITFQFKYMVTKLKTTKQRQFLNINKFSIPLFFCLTEVYLSTNETTLDNYQPMKLIFSNC